MSRRSVDQLSLLTPSTLGPEIYALTPDAATAFAGTGFNPDNPEHCGVQKCAAPDALRYAIAIQQFRDQRRFLEADLARALANEFSACRVDQGPNSTTVTFIERQK